MGQSQCAGSSCFDFLAAAPKGQKDQGGIADVAGPSSATPLPEVSTTSRQSATSMWQPASSPQADPAEEKTEKVDAGTSPALGRDSLEVATPKAQKEVKAVSPSGAGAALTDREGTACTTSTACTEKTGDENAAEDLRDIDLGRLCAALGSLERSTAPSLEGRHAETEAAIPERPPTSLAGHSRCSSWQPQVSAVQATPTTFRPSHKRQASEGTGLSRTSGGSSPATTNTSGGQGSRARDAQRMEAWFQRVLAKNPDGQYGVKPGTEAGPMTVSSPAMKVTSRHSTSPPIADFEKPKPAEPVAPDREKEAQQKDSASHKSGAMLSTDEADLTLEISLGGSQLGTLLFKYGQDLHGVCNDFVTNHRLRDVFRSPLQSHVELLVHMGKKTDSVDVVDLL